MALYNDTLGRIGAIPGVRGAAMSSPALLVGQRKQHRHLRY